MHEIATAGPAGAALSNPGDALQVCATLLKSGMLPADIKSPEAAFAILQTGAEMGLGPMQALRSIHVVKGRPILSADLMVAMALRSGQCLYFRCVETTAEVATYETRREGMPEPVRMSYTMSEAQAAGLTRNPTWRAHTRAMLRARAKSALARDVYPDLVAGLYTPDEGREIAGEYRERNAQPVEAGQVVDAEVVERQPSAPPASDADPFAKSLADNGLTVAQWDAWATAGKRTLSGALTDDQRRRAAAWLDGEGSAIVSGWLSRRGDQ
jgi:hypothetical protein